MAAKFTEDNRKFFDDLASKYDIAPWYRDVAAQITTYTQQQLDFIGLDHSTSDGDTQAGLQSRDASLLDYACGTGMVSRALGPYVNTIQALDLSTNMVARYKELATSSTVASVKNATARVGDLFAEGELPAELSGPDLHGFSIAAVCAALHHFADPGLAIKRLAERLRPGGVLLIIDFLEENEASWASSPADHTIHKHGFGQHEMQDLMGRAELVEFGWKVMPEKVELKMDEKKPVLRTVFLARAMRQVA